MIDCNRPVIVIAEDDPDDQLLIREAFADTKIANPLLFVTNGIELMKFLNHDESEHESYCDKPGLILLDLNMPYKDGKVTLQEIKTDMRYKLIPVVVLTTSGNQSDVLFCYENGAEGYVTKPGSYDELVSRLKAVSKYWLDTVEIPD